MASSGVEPATFRSWVCAPNRNNTVPYKRGKKKELHWGIICHFNAKIIQIGDICVLKSSQRKMHITIFVGQFRAEEQTCPSLSCLWSAHLWRGPWAKPLASGEISGARPPSPGSSQVLTFFPGISKRVALVLIFMIFNRKDGIIALVRDEQKKFPRGGIVLLINYQTDFTGIMMRAKRAKCGI